MTADLPAGRELDFVVHEIVTGERRPYAEQRVGPVPTDWELSCPPYSTDIAAAWLVVEAMREKGHTIQIQVERHHTATSFARIIRPGSAFADRPTEQWDAPAPTAPLAICRAALRAVGQGWGRRESAR